MKELRIKKLYYSISEVSEMTSLKPYVLRYWESEFPQLRPSKNRAGNRIYRQNDIKTIILIRDLLYKDKYTIDGARKKLQEMAEEKQDAGQLNLSLNDGKNQQIVEEMKEHLKEIIELLERK